jgi:NAD(P)-dependent dehydrogenase (short-subunit alcohol dehydrogenase family)
MANEPQTIVVTGASSGFGRETAERFAAAGWRVFAGIRDPRGRHAEESQALERQGIRVVDLEVTDQAAVDRASAEILAAGPVDVLVNNAGGSYAGVVEAFTPEAVERQFQVNVFGALRVSRAFLPGMRERRRGLVVYISSMTGRVVVPFVGVYASSKAALEALAEASSYELAPLGVDIAIVQPGAYGTNIASSRTTPDDPQCMAAYGEVAKLSANVGAALAQSASGRDAREVADAIFALANQAPGTRPLRTLVPHEENVARLNAAHTALQRAALEAMKLGELLPKLPV